MALFILAWLSKGRQMARLVLAFILIGLPLLELALLVRTGQVIGFWATLGMVIGAGVIGALVLSRQSLTVLRRTQEALAQGRPPVAPVLDGAFLLLAGALLITPGFLTDVLALLLLIPPIRHAVARWSVRRLVRSAHVRINTFRGPVEDEPKRSPAGTTRPEGPIIEGEFERLGEKTTEPHRGKGRDRL
jgi:UPF0716 protein FxsA